MTAMAGTGLPWLLAVGAIGTGIAALIKAWSVLRKVETDAGGSMRGDLLARINLLEGRIAELERKLALEQAKHAGEVQILRHKVANETQTTETVLMWAEGSPDKLQEMLPKIRSAREERARQIALEQGAMAGAQMGATGP